MKKLTVILGAGASASINQLASFESDYIDNAQFKPPLTNNIFNAGRIPNNILTQYPLALVLSSDIVRKIKQNKNGIGLEQILKQYQETIEKNGQDFIRRQFLQIPLYLNNLFGEVGENFTKRPDEYNILVNLVLDKVDKVLFLTTNYDTLLEIPLGNIFDFDFANEDQYINDKWSLVKIHGSTNWYRRFRQFSLPPELNEASYLKMLANTSYPLQLEDQITVLSRPSFKNRFMSNIPLYPVITVPVDGKYEINCPTKHKEKAEEFISDCENYLIIGSSGKDADLLELISKNTKKANFLIVGRNAQSVKLVQDNFQKGLSSIKESNFDVYFSENGFSDFIAKGVLDSYLDSNV